MAANDIFFTGFEGGKRDWDSSQSNTLFVDDSLARTGEYYLQCFLGVAAANNGRIIGPTPTAGQNLADSYAKGITRVFFKLITAPSADHVMIMGYCTNSNPAVGGILQVKTNRTFAANCYATVGTYSTAVLALDTWYRSDLTLHLIDSGVNGSANLTCSIYNEAGTLIETVTSSVTGLADTPDFQPPALGHHDVVSSTYNVKFDDWYSQVVDAQTPVFPTATRITRVDAISKDGAAWSGVYQNIINIPYSLSAVDAIIGSTLHAKVKFSHNNATVLGISDIEGLNLYTMMIAGVAGNENIIINDDVTVTAVLTTYPTYPYLVQRMGSLTLIDFNALTFGVDNKRAETVTVAQQYMEVLHGGSNLPRDLTGTDSWKHKVVEFIANGSFGTVTGVGFRPQVIILKKYDGTDSAGFFKLGINGGTQARAINATTVDPLAIQYMTDDGFTYGPSLQSGQTYVALCIQDGGLAEDCKFMRYGAFVAAPSLGTTIVVKASWEPDFIMVQGDDLLLWASDAETVGDSVPLNNSATATGYIATITSSGFTVGTNLDNGRVYYYFAIRMLTGLSALFNYNKFTASGATHTTTGLGFLPAFAIGKRIAAIIAQWRSVLVHSATDSSIWDTVVTNATGITAFNAAGMDFGSSLAQAAEVTKWLAFKSDGEITTGSLVPTANAGPDQNVVFLDQPVTLAGSGTGGSYPCAVLTYTWLLTGTVAGAVVVIADNTNPASGVTFSKPGTYTFLLTVENGVGNAGDEVQITLTCAGPNTVGAGPDQTVSLGDVVQLDGSST